MLARTHTMSQYFCYISHEKVDNLLSNYEEADLIEWDVQQKTTSEKKTSGGIGKLIEIISANLSYGRSDMVLRHKKLRRSYGHKLHALLQHVADNVHEFGSSAPGDLAAGSLLIFTGEFLVKSQDEKARIVTLASHPSADMELLLHCSLRYFSATLDDDTPKVTSTNYAFFNGELAAMMDTTFILLGVKDAGRTVVGSPLYLSLEINEKLVL